jgi:hypothetical protein
MSEDCHDSNNAPVQDDTQIVSCYECGQPVKPEQAYPCEIENLDGSTEVVVFHVGLDRMCPMLWAAKQLQRINNKLEAALNLLLKGTDASSGL